MRMYKVCIDTGGTFTDCVVLDKRGSLSEFKSPSTPPDFSQGVMNVLGEAAASYEKSLGQFISETELIVHGTTAATNALVTRNVARTAMITTKGFRDILEMRRSLKIETHSMYEAFIPPYDPIVPRYLRFVVEEETLPSGEITKPVDVHELREVIAKIKSEKCEAVAVCFINSYVNSENERIATEICKKELPDAFISCSSDILPKMGEYERESTCVMCACLGPVVGNYMRNLEDSLKKAGFDGELLIMQANQYVQSVEAVLRKPAYVMGSGPAAAPAGAAFLGTMTGKKNFITADMGGTTFDSALVINNGVILTPGMWLGDDRLGFKAVEVSSIGAGGGSIGALNALGLLQVGPRSAGADPGPVCYGKGGSEPTVTDAAVILGYIPADNFWGGKMKLNVGDAKASLKTIADRLEMSVEQAAEAMMTTVSSNMADGISEISTRRGFDVREFTLLAIGGGGGLCGAEMADLLGIREVMVPKFSSSFSAWSMFAMDMGRDYLRSYIATTNDADIEKMNQLYEDMMLEARKEFKALNVSQQDVIFEKSADVRYTGQYHEIEMPLPSEEIAPKDIDALDREFHKRHEALFTFSMEWVPAEIRNLRLIAKVKATKMALPRIETGTEDASGALKRKRECFFNGKFRETSIYDGAQLKAGNVLLGPSIIEEPTTTVVIPDGFNCGVDEYGNYLLRKI
jgi:N-methylhydantoinase A